MVQRRLKKAWSKERAFVRWCISFLGEMASTSPGQFLEEGNICELLDTDTLGDGWMHQMGKSNLVLCNSGIWIYKKWHRAGITWGRWGWHLLVCWAIWRGIIFLPHASRSTWYLDSLTGIFKCCTLVSSHNSGHSISHIMPSTYIKLLWFPKSTILSLIHTLLSHSSLVTSFECFLPFFLP